MSTRFAAMGFYRPSRCLMSAIKRYNLGASTLSLLCANVVAGCSQNALAGPEITALPATYSLAPKQNTVVTSEDRQLQIQFEQLLRDSRCPSGVTCVWAGEAVVMLSVSTRSTAQKKEGKYDDVESLQLSTMNNSKVVQGLQIKLLSVAPYPDAQQRGAKDDYRITLMVTK